jgi:hypothetical protein
VASVIAAGSGSPDARISSCQVSNQAMGSKLSDVDEEFISLVVRGAWASVKGVVILAGVLESFRVSVSTRRGNRRGIKPSI